MQLSENSNCQHIPLPIVTKCAALTRRLTGSSIIAHGIKVFYRLLVSPAMHNLLELQADHVREGLFRVFSFVVP